MKYSKKFAEIIHDIGVSSQDLNLKNFPSQLFTCSQTGKIFLDPVVPHKAIGTQHPTIEREYLLQTHSQDPFFPNILYTKCTPMKSLVSLYLLDNPHLLNSLYIEKINLTELYDKSIIEAHINTLKTSIALKNYDTITKYTSFNLSIIFSYLPDILKNANEDVQLHLLNNTINLNYIDLNNNGIQLVHLICKYSPLSIIKHVFETKNININSVDFNGQTPFIIACIHRSWDIIEYILSLETCDVSHVHNGFNSYEYSITQNKIDIIEGIISSPRINHLAKNKYGMNYVEMAFRYSNNAVHKFLIEKSYEKVLINPSFLRMLFSECNPDQIISFIELGITSDEMFNGTYAMHMILKNKHTTIGLIKYIISKIGLLDFSFNTYDKNGWDMFHVAAFYAKYDVVHMLLQYAKKQEPSDTFITKNTFLDKVSGQPLGIGYQEINVNVCDLLKRNQNLSSEEIINLTNYIKQF